MAGRPKGSKNKQKTTVYSEMPAPNGPEKPRRRKSPGPATASPPPSGHNGGLSDDEMRALAVQGAVAIEKLTKQIESLSGERRAERAKLKIHGVERHVIDHMLARRKAIEAGKLGEELQKTIDRAKVDRWLNIQPGLTEDLFAPPPSEVAFEAGKLAGMEGKTCKPPDEYNQDDQQRWMEGHREAQTIVMGGFKKPPAPSIENAASADPPGGQVSPVGPGPGEPVTEDLRPRFAQQREADAIDSLLEGGGG